MAFAKYERVPFTAVAAANNQAEQDLRPFKTKLKVSNYFRTLKGAQIHARIFGFISTTRKHQVQVANDEIQYQNWSTPIAMSRLLQILHEGSYLSDQSTKLLLEFMSISNEWFDRRIKGLLPPDTPLVHKTGTVATYDKLTKATKDAGIITLPDGSCLAISVFVADSYDSQTKREQTIAKFSKAAYDYWIKKNK